ncbi:MAG: o-succinylbenzoate synthase [Bacteroidaceae bacterium]|nr:o-succinylbenzoate synthase [Bacteroidaceae bacterium]
MLRARYAPYRLLFKEPSGTSRGIMTYKECYMVQLSDDTHPGRVGWGECALFRGLGSDDSPEYERVLAEACSLVGKCPFDEVLQRLDEWTSIRFGFETAWQELNAWRDYPSRFDSGEQPITINGLVWMGDKATMLRRIEEKLNAGFRCVKLKIGAIDFDAELDLLRMVRNRFSRNEIELRVDANGAFAPTEAPRKLEALSHYDLHSIEQPIKAGLWEDMARLCACTPIPIALDEELVACRKVTPELAAQMLDTIKPQYIILKPSLTGGLSGTNEWIKAANARSIGWWITSALESNVGLAAIARYTASLHTTMPQGLGTGALYTNNISSPLCQEGEVLTYRPQGEWQYPELAWK